MDDQVDIPIWLAIARTNLLVKNETTELADNYRSIACLDVTYKLYINLLDQFLQSHRKSYYIVSDE